MIVALTIRGAEYALPALMLDGDLVGLLAIGVSYVVRLPVPDHD
jgi:hypothetical protein